MESADQKVISGKASSTPYLPPAVKPVLFRVAGGNYIVLAAQITAHMLRSVFV